MKHVDIYTDGACTATRDRAATVRLLFVKEPKRCSAADMPDTTNNRMELTGVIESLACLKEPCEVTLTTDSKYVCRRRHQGLGQKLAGQRLAQGRQKARPQQRPMGAQLLCLLEKHRVTIVWCKGHAGHPYNERCDRLAVAEYEKLKAKG